MKHLQTSNTYDHNGKFNKLSKSIGCQRIQNNIFQKQVDNLLSKNQALQINIAPCMVIICSVMIQY